MALHKRSSSSEGRGWQEPRDLGPTVLSVESQISMP